MKLKKLLKDLDIESVKGSKDIEITGLCSNSKAVAPGNLFIAKRGGSYDGNTYIPEAIDAGASAILTDIYNPFIKHAVQVIHSDVPVAEAVLAANYYEYPDNKLLMIGITGTNGKTTCSFIIKHILDSIGKPCGLIGSLEYIINDYRQKASRTTPDIITNYRLLRTMVSKGCHAAVMEVSSHALDQNRIQGISFDTAVFTNITQDHLDYHKTMRHYSSAKARLFQDLDPRAKKPLMHYHKNAIVNGDDPCHHEMVKNCKAPTTTYGIDNEDVDVRAIDITYSRSKTTFSVTYAGMTLQFNSPLLGRHNVYNSLAGIAFAVNNDIAFDRLPHIIASMRAIPGRLQKVENDLALDIYVDSASTDDALEKVTSFLKSTAERGRLITVFGCGGNRDKSKRPKMAQACERNSHLCIVTNDNPRNEDPETICRAVIGGFSSDARYYIELDRKQAIRYALENAQKGDTILIAGKGHEKEQAFAHRIVAFDDSAIAEEVCRELSQGTVIS